VQNLIPIVISHVPQFGNGKDIAKRHKEQTSIKEKSTIVIVRMKCYRSPTAIFTIQFSEPDLSHSMRSVRRITCSISIAYRSSAPEYRRFRRALNAYLRQRKSN